MRMSEALAVRSMGFPANLASNSNLTSAASATSNVFELLLTGVIWTYDPDFLKI